MSFVENGFNDVFGGGGFVDDGLRSIDGAVDDGLRAIDPMAGARSSAEASAAEQAYQQRALDYLMQQEELPTQMRDQGLTALSDYYGGNQQGVIDQVQSSPLYQSMMEQGQDSVLRNASATGGLRSGNAQTALAQDSQNVLNNAVQQQLSGYSSLAGLDSNANAIANQYGTMGNSVAQGIIGAEQSRQDGVGSAIQTAAMLYFSDIRLKTNVKPVGKENGINLYSWDWNEKAEEELGLFGEAYGVMAHEMPLDKLLLDENTGYLMVKYNEVFQ